MICRFSAGACPLFGNVLVYRKTASWPILELRRILSLLGFCAPIVCVISDTGADWCEVFAIGKHKAARPRSSPTCESHRWATFRNVSERQQRGGNCRALHHTHHLAQRRHSRPVSQSTCLRIRNSLDGTSHSTPPL